MKTFTIACRTAAGAAPLFFVHWNGADPAFSAAVKDARVYTRGVSGLLSTEASGDFRRLARLGWICVTV